MSNQESKAARGARLAAESKARMVAEFDVAAWRERLIEAATSFESGAKRLLNLAVMARGIVEADTAREAFADAFAAALVQVHGVTDTEARASKSLKNRVSDAMAIFKCESLPASLPANLQRAADAVRKANPSGKTRKPRAGGKAPVQVPAGQVNPLALLEAALEALRLQAGDNELALSVIGELVDLAGDLADVLAGEEVEDQAA